MTAEWWAIGAAIAATVAAIVGGVVCVHHARLAVRAAEQARSSAKRAYDEVESFYVNRDAGSGRAVSDE